MIRTQIDRIKDTYLNKLYQYSIYRRLIWCFIYVFVLPILLIGGFNAIFSFVNNEHEAKIFLEQSSTQIANNISYYVFFHMNLLDDVADNPQIINDLGIYEQVDWNMKSEIENRIRLVLGNAFGGSGAINSCEMLSVNGSFFYYPSPISNGDFESSSLLTTSSDSVLMKISKKDVVSDRNTYVILTRGIFNEENRCIGNIVTALELAYFNKACYENVTNLFNEVMIIDENNSIVSASDLSQIGTTYTGDRLTSISIYKTIPNTKLTVVNRISLSTLLNSALIQFGITLLMAIFFAVLALFIALLFTRSIASPINRLMEEMNKPQVDKYIEDFGDDEYHTVIEGFNEMNGHIVEAIQSQYKMELQETELRELQKEAELSALQQQINPHFLYNTLESIYWNGQLEGDEDISEIVSALGNYLRVIIVKGREYVTVENEVESVNNYIFLQNKRFGNRIINSWEVPTVIRQTKITKLAIHPIVEDIITTNLDDIEGQIVLNTNINEESGVVKVSMCGQAVSYFLSISETPTVDMRGVNSVNERLSLYYGEAFGVELNIHDEKIIVKIPVYVDTESAGEINHG